MKAKQRTKPHRKVVLTNRIPKQKGIEKQIEQTGGAD